MHSSRRLDPIRAPRRGSTALCPWLRSLAFATLTIAALGAAAPAQEQESEIQALRREIEELKRADREKQTRITNLENALEKSRQQSEAVDPNDALDRALRDLGAAADEAVPLAAPVIPPASHLLDISIGSNLLFGTSSATDTEIAALEAGDHDPSR